MVATGCIAATAAQIDPLYSPGGADVHADLSIYGTLGPSTRVYTVYRHTCGSAVFARLAVVTTNKHTDRQTEHVRGECRCSARMFSAEVRPHHTAGPWPSLATSSTEDRVQTRCACFPLPAWHCSATPCTRTVQLCGRHGLPSSTQFCFDARAARSTNVSRHCRRPRLRSLRNSSRLERSVIWRHHVAIADRLSTTAQHTALQPLVWSLTGWLPFLSFVTLSLVFFSVKCSWSFFWLHGTIVTIIIFVHNNNGAASFHL